MFSAKHTVSERLREAIARTLQETGANLESFSALLGVPATTVYNWMTGRHKPSRKRLREICARMNWNYEELFLSGALLDKAIHQPFLSLDACQAHYRDVLHRDPFLAMLVTAQAGLLVFHQLMIRGVSLTFTVDHLFNVRLDTLDPALGGLRLAVSGHESVLRVALQDSEGRMQGEWKPLNESVLRYYGNTFMDYKKSKAS